MASDCIDGIHRRRCRREIRAIPEDRFRPGVREAALQVVAHLVRCRKALYNLAVHFIYIVRCADGTLYTGYAIDPDAREKVHNTGKGARYTASRRPVALVHTEAFRTKSKALKREGELKRWTRAKKEELCSITRAR